tara:strand:+ start:153 stop:929 length:777 start_codon:yes stop_codon:yes gene_type:complete
MYKLYKNNKGRITQVPVAQNDPEEDLFFPDPLEAKGNVPDVAPFVIQQKQQFDLIKENETQQARFQTKKLQNSNYQLINFLIIPTDSTTTQNYYFNDYNASTAVGSGVDACVMFGTDTAGSDKAKYYNIVYANARFRYIQSGTNEYLLPSSFIEFYPLQKIPGGNFPGKIPRQIEAKENNTGVQSLTISGTQYGVQSFGIDVYNENAYYAQSADLKGIRCCGIALKLINLNFANAIALNDIKLIVEIGYDQNTEGDNY